MITTHKDLDVWKKSMDLVMDVYRDTQTFPKEEVSGLTSQIRRSAVSIPSNVAEGASRNSKKEFCQHLYIALGSASELETQIKAFTFYFLLFTLHALHFTSYKVFT